MHEAAALAMVATTVSAMYHLRCSPARPDNTGSWHVPVQAALYVGSLPPLQSSEPVNQAGMAAMLLKRAARNRRAEADAILQAALGLQAQCLVSRDAVINGGSTAGPSAAEELPLLLRALGDAMLAATEAAQTAAGHLLLKPSGGQVDRGNPEKAS